MPPNTELALPLGRHAHTHSDRNGAKQTSDMLPYCTTVWDLHCHYIPKPLSSTTPHRSSRRPIQAGPAQLCVIQPRPGWHKFTLHLRHQLCPSPHHPHHNLSHHLSLDGWRLGTDGRPVASVLATAICFVSSRKARETLCMHLPASQLAMPRAVVSKNAAPCRRTLAHCHRAIQCDWSGPFSQSSQVWRRPDPPVAPPAPFSPFSPWHPD